MILNPAEVIGRFDHNLQWGRMVLAVYHNQVPFVPPGAASFCSAAEVGRAHVRALRYGEPGQRYILARENHSYRAFIDTISELLGKRYRAPMSPYWWLYLKALIRENLHCIGAGKSLVEPYRIRVFGGSYLFDSGKAVRHIGYQTVALKSMLSECIEWYRNNGFLKIG